jgi:hypothetical protein
MRRSRLMLGKVHFVGEFTLDDNEWARERDGALPLVKGYQW